MKRKTRLGALEQRFLSYAQLQNLKVVKLGQLRSALFLSAEQEKKLLSRLALSGIIVRLKRGVYLIPSRLPLGGLWNPGEYTILTELMKASDFGKYQLCGLQVFNHYGFSEQVSNQIYCYNNRISGNKTIAGMEFNFIKVDSKRLGGIKEIITDDNSTIIMPTKTRALMDAVYDWSRFGTLPEAYSWIREELGKDPSLAGDLLDMTIKFGNLGTLRRIGYLLDSIGMIDRKKEKIIRKFNKKKSVVPFVPENSMQGTLNNEWGIIDNE
jgi:predicted transcriptional regulator of viral defense system